ncbi:MAG TPA: hypothetical protein PKE16_07315 [Hyphomicrobium sp.]|nr:hypothetical protein [Hyphomicrobium sp.]
MDIFLLRIFQSQVLAQCETLLAAANGINAGLGSKNTRQVFNEIQNLLNAGANISKLLWGQRGAQANPRAWLRESIGVTDASPLREVSMRNHFEHLDERIDRWWQESPNHNFVDGNIGPANMIAGLPPGEIFRHFDPSSTEVTFWGESFNIQSLVDEVQLLLPRLREEANKPPWETD